jgi:hypothetical protein
MDDLYIRCSINIRRLYFFSLQVIRSCVLWLMKFITKIEVTIKVIKKMKERLTTTTNDVDIEKE